MKRLASVIAALALTAAAPAPSLDQVVTSAKFDGVVVAGDSAKPHYVHGDASATWRWASVTKQLTTAIVMQEVQAGRLSLDRPIADWWPEWPHVYADLITVRQLLQHTSGLADPNEDGPNEPSGMPLFYRPPPGHGTMRYEATHYCAEHPRAKPGLVFHYDNCDFIVLGALLEHTTGKPYAQLLQERIAAPLGLRIGLFAPDRPPAAHVRGIEKPGKPEDIGNLGTYGAAGSAYGSPLTLYAFDRALINRTLVGETATAEMWKGEPKWGQAALGQWQFEATLAGCTASTSIVERRGEIGGIQVRNFILPAMGKALVMFTRRGDFDFGEVWQAKGFAYRALSAVGCAK